MSSLALIILVAGCAQKPLKEATLPNDDAGEQPENQAENAETQKDDSSAIKIGWIGPLSGDVAVIGQDGLKAAELAIQEINSAGGIKGRQIELIPEDGKCNAKDSAQAANKLINIDKVPVILGGICSGETLSAAPIAEENKVVLLSGCSSAPTITDAGDYIFRTYPSDSFRGKFSADYVYNTLGKKKAAVITTLGDWGSGNKDSFVSRFRELGGEIVVSEDFMQDSRDIRTELTKVKNSDAEVLVFYAYTEASIAGLKQAKELGIDIPLIGGDVWSDSKLHESGLAEGILYPEILNEFDETWAKKMDTAGVTVLACAYGEYDAAKILAEVIAKAGTDPEKIKNELYNVKDYQGVNGPITIDENGDITFAEYEMKTVKDGKPVSLNTDSSNEDDSGKEVEEEQSEDEGNTESEEKVSQV